MATTLFIPALHGATVAPVATLFIPELDGQTFPSVADSLDFMYGPDDGQADIEAEMAGERALETNDQYAWEVEQDELRAAAFAF